MNTRAFRTILAPGAIAVLLATSGCATLLHGTTQKVRIQTDPAGATATAGGQTIRTPGVLRLSRRSAFVEVRIEKDGYTPQVVRLDRTGSSAVWWNLTAIPAGVAVGVAGGNLGNFVQRGAFGGAGVAAVAFAADYSAGGAYELVPARIVVKLAPVEPVARLR